jgi:outer membrane receptor protein involved in Fe transport
MAAWLVLGSALAAGADDSAPAPPTEEAALSYAEEILVTATRTEQPAGALPGAVTVLQREEVLASGARTADEVLRRVPGFALFRDTSSVAVSTPTLSVSFRGLGGTSASRALVLVDGVPMNDPFGGWVHWPRVPVQSIERVEVVRGGSVLWGNLATGGLINIVTRRPGSDRLAVGASGGNRSTVQASASAAGGGEAVSYGLHGYFFDTDGGYRLVERQLGAVDRPVAAEDKLVEGVVDVRRAAGERLSFKAGYFADDRSLGDDVARDSTRIGYASAGASLPRAGGDWRFHGYFSHNTFAARSSSVNAARTTVSPATDQYDVPSRAGGGDAQWVRRGARHELTVGIDGQWVRGETNEDSRFVDGAFTRRRHTGGEQVLGGLWVQDIVQLAPRWRLLGAARLDSWHSRDGFRQEEDLARGIALEPVAFEAHSVTVGSPSLGVVFRPGSAWTLRASAYAGFRAPTINELYRPVRVAGDNITEANPSLEPERVRGAELGVVLSPGRAFHAETTFFWTELERAVFSVTIGRADGGPATIPPCGFLPAGGSCRQRQNVGVLRSLGVELTLQSRVTSWLSAHGELMLLDSEVTSAPQFPQLVGKQGRMAPEAMAGVGARLTGPKGLSFAVDARWVGPRYDDDLNVLRIGSLVTLNAALERDLRTGLTLFLSGENLLDRENPIGRNGALEEIGVPFLVRLGARWRLGSK